MKKVMLCVFALAAMCTTTARSQDISGEWQGTLKAGKDLRIVLKIFKGDKDGWSAKMYSIDQGGQPVNVTSLTRQGSTIKMAVDLIGGTYEGRLSEDGKSIAGTWTQGPQPLPLILLRTTPETAWEIPAPPEPPKPMAEDADPSFDVATIKPNPSGEASMQQLTIIGRNFTIRNGSLGDLIAFAYGVQMKQIVSAPDWIDKDRYDIAAVPDQPGAPNPEQLKTMIRKLLENRFKMTLHHEKRELPAYVLTVAKAGQKLTPTQLKGPLPGIGIRPAAGGVTLNMANATLGDFTGFLQMLVLDRPVVDHTGITGRFDYKVTFTPDDSQFNGHPPKVPAQTDASDPSPDLFTSIQQQLGLKLTAEKTAVDVIAIDRVEKPSPN